MSLGYGIELIDFRFTLYKILDLLSVKFTTPFLHPYGDTKPHFYFCFRGRDHLKLKCVLELGRDNLTDKW